ncbi:hypothetical protein MKK75_30745 [Methylobacterium sp. J-030]|uniref:hypothetical protein n=1 Tax=Methylobacterium sp. J-030 TaxID=2836627 RepID=UPI001FB90974|nr:hypothetical protein [Methylobacterium sp. J-030]MCJ2073112.1 hypothetical protein [Methylobacterium sp. J-030]
MTPTAFANQAVAAQDRAQALDHTGGASTTPKHINEKGQTMGGTTAQEFSEDLFAKAYRYQISLQLLVKECELKDAALRKLEGEVFELRTREQNIKADNTRLKQAVLFSEQVQSDAQAADERAKTADIVLDAVIKSLRPLGLDKKKFRRAIADIGRQIPNGGPQASQHFALLNAARKVLSREL